MKNNIKQFREELGWSQEKLAVKAGTSGPQINRLEKSRRRLTQEWMVKLADALGCHPSDLLPPHDSSPRKTESASRGALRDSAAPETVPVLGRAGKSADSIMLMDEEETGHTGAHPAQAGSRRAFAFYARGESMAPRYRAGELVYAVRGRPPAEGQDCLVELSNGESFLRQFLRQTEGKIICRQLSPEKELRYDSGKLRAIHAVVGRG